eukprot:3599343-Rhodomonas_salina.1
MASPNPVSCTPTLTSPHSPLLPPPLSALSFSSSAVLPARVLYFRATQTSLRLSTLFLSGWSMRARAPDLILCGISTPFFANETSPSPRSSEIAISSPLPHGTPIRGFVRLGAHCFGFVESQRFFLVLSLEFFCCGVCT